MKNFIVLIICLNFISCKTEYKNVNNANILLDCLPKKMFYY